MKRILLFAALLLSGMPAFAQQPATVPETRPFELYNLERAPVFPGGEKALGNYLFSTIKYPEDARRNRQEGMVVLAFTVGRDGVIQDVEIVRGVSPSIDAEALRVVRSMPTWQPGEMGGQKVDVRYTLPVRFKLAA
jgi:TonB family protein